MSLSPNFIRAIEWSQNNNPTVPPGVNSTPAPPPVPTTPTQPANPFALNLADILKGKSIPTPRGGHVIGLPGYPAPPGTFDGVTPATSTPTGGTSQLPVPSSPPTGSTAGGSGGGAAYNPYVSGSAATATDWKKYAPWLGVLVFVIVLFTILRKKR